MDFNPSPWEIALRMAVAVALASAVGWEREIRRKPAGLKTHTLVALGACCFTLLGVQLTHYLDHQTGLGRPDPIRIVEGIVGGLGFLGAGAIIQSRGSVLGLTTAAGIWVVGAMGAAIGLGMYAIALITLAFTMVVLLVLRRLEPDARGNGIDGASAKDVDRPDG